MSIRDICYVASPGSGGPQHEERYAVTQPSEPILVGDIIYPNRYDITVRSRLAGFFLANEDLWNKDRMGFMQLARKETICGISHDWLQTRWNWWAVPGWEPVEDPHHEAFEVDCLKISRLVHNLDTWQEGSRIQIVRAHELLPAVNGEMLEETLYLGDGQHRLSVLHHMGVKELKPEQYEYLEYKRYAPFITTDMYERAGVLPDNWRETAYGVD